MLQPIKIGNIVIDTPVILAPMAGVTDLPFRRLVRKFGGVGLTVSEMIASRAIIQQTKKSIKKIQKDDENAPMVVQIAGADPKYMVQAAKLNEDLGADIIDINFGCPVKKVVKGFAGSALMRDEKLATEIMKAVVDAVKVPVTVKMRMGWDMNNLNAPTLAKIAEDVGVKMVTVHGRTRSQMYSGTADWKFIHTVKDAVNIPVIANGDIRTPQDAEKCLEESGADGIMIGRGAYGKPWLLNQITTYLKTGQMIPAPTIAELKDVALQHFLEIIEYYGEEHGVIMARKHLGWYSSGMNSSGEFRGEINKIKDIKEMEKAIKEFFK